jgi:hypothetical protein
MRKLFLLALAGFGVWRYLNRDSGGAPPTPAPAPGGAPPERVQEAEITPTEELRSDQPASAGIGDAVMPDTSADDPLVREQEDAARAEAASVGEEPEDEVR